jgi:RNA polymerase sigma-70 factor (ECF subfamily)
MFPRYIVGGGRTFMNEPAERLFELLLVVRCQSGDEEAYRELVGRFGPRLRYFLRKLLPHGDRADDLLQEIWMDVFRQMPRLQHAGAFTPWIYRIARGKVALALRRNGLAPPAAQLPELAAEHAEPEFSLEDAARIHSALDELPPEQREVLVLRFLEELSYEEIGQVVGCPLGTVRSRIHYAKLALQRLLEH